MAANVLIGIAGTNNFGRHCLVLTVIANVNVVAEMLAMTAKGKKLLNL